MPDHMHSSSAMLCLILSAGLAACGRAGGGGNVPSSLEQAPPTVEAANAPASASSAASSDTAPAVYSATSPASARTATAPGGGDSLLTAAAPPLTGTGGSRIATADNANPSAGGNAPTAAALAAAEEPSSSAVSTHLTSASAMTTLTVAGPVTRLTTTINAAGNATCKTYYTAPTELTHAAPAARPANGGVFFSNAELATWRQRLSTGPFLQKNDYTKGSPADWARITRNAAAFMQGGDKGPTSSTVSDDFGHLGSTARDAAFLFLTSADSRAFAAVRNYLIAQAANPAADFASTLCLTDLTNWKPDSYFFQASWLLRYLVTYDYVRSAMNATDRLKVENYIRRNAYFFATQMDYALKDVFPNRLSGDYTKKAGPAAATTESGIWYSKRYDTNGDCKVDDKDKAAADATYAYVRSDGQRGPRLSVISQYYNNRRAAAALMIGAAGVALADPVLVATAKRYTFEWLAYSVWPDGSQGEFTRNGDYCIPQQGVIYSGANTASAALLATLLTRQGDTSVQQYSTRAGLFGSESTGSAPAKTLQMAVSTQLGLVHGTIKWHYHQPWLSKPELNAGNGLFGMVSYYLKGRQPLENYHELGLLPAAKLLPDANIAALTLREKGASDLAFPGASGNTVTTGWGNWNDPFNALPSILLTRP